MRAQTQRGPAQLAELPEQELLEAVQRQTFGFFWEAAHPLSGLAPDRCKTVAGPADDLVATGGSGFGLMALLVAVERGWIARGAAAERVTHMLDLLARATCFHGVFPHFMNGRTGATIPFTRKDRVKITGIWGWADVPPNVTAAALILAADLFKAKDAPWGIAGFGDLGMVKVQSNPWVVELLRGYINVSSKVGV